MAPANGVGALLAVKVEQEARQQSGCCRAGAGKRGLLGAWRMVVYMSQKHKSKSGVRPFGLSNQDPVPGALIL